MPWKLAESDSLLLLPPVLLTFATRRNRDPSTPREYIEKHAAIAIPIGNPIRIHPSASRLLLSSDPAARGGPPTGGLLRRLGTPAARYAGPLFCCRGRKLRSAGGAVPYGRPPQVVRLPAREPARGPFAARRGPLRLRVHGQRRSLPASNLGGFSGN
ncbi:hypothetical protein GQ55_3G332500 [Panicum hallii var. hallii]|uniref:Uncharacterized protein n=1 Tax=Panicum hallii var. hallii TaxID=1504633 RepID=A0A2T7EFK1_9POAL|nr:hypothetical protein GQ55_3G332500 [Panicum hallii var. hallii]